MVGKYNEELLEVLSNSKIKSTNEILKDLEKKIKKKLNWHLLYRYLSELTENGKVEKMNAKAAFFWRRK